jgi:hypothetical protein
MPQNKIETLVNSLSRLRSGTTDAVRLRAAIEPLAELIPDVARLQKALPRQGPVYVGQFSGSSRGASVLSGLNIAGRIRGLDRARLESELDGIYVDENGNIHHTGTGTGTTTPSDTGPTTPSTDPAVDARKQEGFNFARSLLALPWSIGTFTTPPMTLELIRPSPAITKQLRDVLSNTDKLAGFKSGIVATEPPATKENSDRWQRVFSFFTYDVVRQRANEAVVFGPYTGLSVLLLNGVPIVGKRTDTVQVTNVVYSSLTGPQPTDAEKAESAGDAVSALVNATWHHDFVCTKAEMTHEQAQMFGKGCKVFGPFIRDIGTKLQQDEASSSSSDQSSDSSSAKQIVGTILVVLGNILSEVGQGILNADHGNGINLLTNFWLGILLTGVPIVWPESR